MANKVAIIAPPSAGDGYGVGELHVIPSPNGRNQ